MTMEFDDFYKLACETFGEDKFTIKPKFLTNIEELNFKYECNLTQEDFDNYKAVWILGNQCPSCEQSLSFSFEWGIIHGSGFCSSCKKVGIKYYHYIGDCKTPFSGWSLIGF